MMIHYEIQRVENDGTKVPQHVAICTGNKIKTIVWYDASRAAQVTQFANPQIELAAMMQATDRKTYQTTQMQRQTMPVVRDKVIALLQPMPVGARRCGLAYIVFGAKTADILKDLDTHGWDNFTRVTENHSWVVGSNQLASLVAAISEPLREQRIPYSRRTSIVVDEKAATAPSKLTQAFGNVFKALKND